MKKAQITDGTENTTMTTEEPTPTLAKDMKREDGAKAYRLEGSDRVQWLTPTRAAARNGARSDGKKWVEDPECPADLVEEPKPIPTGDERKKMEQEGREKDEEFMAKRNKAKVDKETKNKDAGDTDPKGEKAEKKPKKKLSSTGAVSRADFHGMSMCEVIRFVGAKHDKAVAGRVAELAGFQPNPSTVYIQAKKGARGDDVPEPNKDQRVALKPLLEQAVSEVKETKAAKSEKKAEKKATKDQKGKDAPKTAKVVKKEKKGKDEGAEKPAKKKVKKQKVEAESAEEQVEAAAE